MNTKNLQQQRRKEAYQQAQVKGTHELAPRVGHYVFQKFRIKITAKGLQVPIVETLWKPLNDTSFIEGLNFEVATPSFYSVNATGPKHLEVNKLIDKMIVVTDVTVYNNVIGMSWSIIDENPVITKPKSLFSMASPSYDDINRMNNRYGIDENPIDEQPYDAMDDIYSF